MAGSRLTRYSITALYFRVVATYYSFKYKVAIRSIARCEFSVDIIYIISTIELRPNIKLP